MKKKFLSFIFVFALLVPCLFLITACGEKSISTFSVVLGGEKSTSLNLGSYEYTSSSIQPVKEDLDKISFEVKFTDGSTINVKNNDSKISLFEVQKDSEALTELPEIFDVGFYSLKYSYDGKEENYVEVYFSIMQGKADYQISNLATEWEYLAMPNLDNVTISAYTGSQTPTYYYVDKNYYDSLITENPNALDDLYILPQEFHNIYSRVPAGSWYILALVPYEGNYKEQFTSPYEVNVEKSVLNAFDNFNVTASYKFDGSEFDEVLLSSITPTVEGALYAYNTNYPEELVSLSLNGWVEKNQSVNFNNQNEINTEVNFSLYESYQNNFEINITKQASLTIQKGEIELSKTFFESGSLIQNKEFSCQKINYNDMTFDLDVTLDDENFYDINGYKEYINSIRLYDLDLNSNVDVYLKVDSQLTKLTNYGYEGKVKLVVVKNAFSGYYLTIQIDNKQIGEYNLEFRILDNVNYEWVSGYYNGQEDLGENIPFVVKIEQNDTEFYPSFHQVSVDENGAIELTFEIDKNSLDSQAQASEIVTFERIESYGEGINQVFSNVTHSGNPEISFAEQDNENNKVIVVKLNNLDFSSDSQPYYCYKISVQTSDDYKNIVYEKVVDSINKLIINYTDSVVNHYAQLQNSQNENVTIDNNVSGEITIQENASILSLFSNLSSKYGTWDLQYKNTKTDSYETLNESNVLQVGESIEIKLTYSLSVSYAASGVKQITIVLNA